MELSVKDLIEVLKSIGQPVSDSAGVLESGAENIGLSSMVGKDVIIRTYSAGVHFGKLKEKSGNEVILENSRRLYYWKTKRGISLSEVALTGLHDDSKVCASVGSIWLQPVEIIPCTDIASKSICEKIDHVA